MWALRAHIRYSQTEGPQTRTCIVARTCNTCTTWIYVYTENMHMRGTHTEQMHIRIHAHRDTRTTWIYVHAENMHMRGTHTKKCTYEYTHTEIHVHTEYTKICDFIALHRFKLRLKWLLGMVGGLYKINSRIFLSHQSLVHLNYHFAFL